MGVYSKAYDRLGTRIASAFIQRVGYEKLLQGQLERGGKAPDDLVYKLKFSDEDRQELSIALALPNTMGVNRQNVEDVIDALYFSGFSRYSKMPLEVEGLGRTIPTVPGDIEDEDGYTMAVKPKGILAKQDLGIPYNEPALKIFFMKFATWVDYLTRVSFDIPGGIIPSRWFRNKLERGAADFSRLEWGAELWTGFGTGHHLGVNYKNLSTLRKFERPYLAVHQGGDKSKLGIVTNVTAGLTEKVIEERFTQSKKGDYWEGNVQVGRRNRKVQISKDNKQIKINVLGGKIKSPADVGTVLTALHGYLYPPPEQSE